MHDVVVIGGGFAGVTTARETTLRRADTLLLEARELANGGSSFMDGAIESGLRVGKTALRLLGR